MITIKSKTNLSTSEDGKNAIFVMPSETIPVKVGLRAAAKAVPRVSIQAKMA